jgi:hypothetical protein
MFLQGKTKLILRLKIKFAVGEKKCISTEKRECSKQNVRLNRYSVYMNVMPPFPISLWSCHPALLTVVRLHSTNYSVHIVRCPINNNV